MRKIAFYSSYYQNKISKEDGCGRLKLLLNQNLFLNLHGIAHGRKIVRGPQSNFFKSLITSGLCTVKLNHYFFLIKCAVTFNIIAYSAH